MAITRVLRSAVALLLCSATAFAQVPANDDCANAASVMVGLTPVDSTMATDGAGLPLDPLVCDMSAFGTEQIFQDLWYSFTPTTTSAFDVAVVANGNPSFDSRLAIYDQATCPDDPALVIACDDDSGPGLEAAVSLVPMNMGTTYLIRIGSYASTTTEQPAALSIIANVPPTPPANDDCANATVIPAQGSYMFDNSFAATDGADLAGFCDLGGAGDDNVHKDVWFQYTPALSECTYITMFGLAGFDTRLAIYDATTCPDDPAAVIACSDDEQQPISQPFEAGFDVDLVAGTTYLIRIGSYSNNSPVGFGTFSISTGPGAIDGGLQPGAPGCAPGPIFSDTCNGDGGDQVGCMDCPCGNNAMGSTIGGCLNSAGTSARLEASGDTSVSLPTLDTADLRLSLTGAPAGAFCILNSGDSVAPGNPVHPCIGLNSGVQAVAFDGLRCAIFNTRRHGGRAADANGTVGVTNNPWGGEGGPPVGIANTGNGFAAGQTRYFQVINRDDPLLSCMRGLNTSQALEVTFAP